MYQDQHTFQGVPRQHQPDWATPLSVCLSNLLKSMYLQEAAEVTTGSMFCLGAPWTSLLENL